MSQFRIYVYAADRIFYEGPCCSLILPTLDGLYGIMANHTNTIGGIVPGEMTIRVPEGEDIIASVSPGMFKIENNEVLILVESAERPEEIDINRAKREAAEAKEAILQKRSIQEYHVAQMTLSRAINRLRVKQHHTPQGY